MVWLLGPAPRAGTQTQIKRMTCQPKGTGGKMDVATVRKNHRLPILSGCFVLLGVFGWLDYLTGYELGFFVFYSVPIGIAAWYVGRWPAVGVALGATVTWLLADYYGGVKYSAPWLYYWNGAIHFAAFNINAVTIAMIKSDLDKRHALAVELESARESLRAVAARMPACPGCGQRREDAKSHTPAEVVILAREHPELANALCPDCRANILEVGENADYPVSSSSPLSADSKCITPAGGSAA